ncbi:MAG: endonuclease NucS domain-containing protein, partial [Thermochromatium sp.]
ETERLLKERSQEIDRRFQETDRLFRENARELRELKQQIGGLGDKFGYFTEGLALPSLERLLTERFGMTNVSPRHRVRVGEREQEYDVLAWGNGEVSQVVIVEVKSRAKVEAIEQLKRQLEELPLLVPQLRGLERIGILAGVDWVPGVMEAAQGEGLYTARIHDEIFELTTPDNFKPRLW